MAVLFYFQFRSIDDLASTSSVVLRQLSQETADATARDVEDTLKRPHIGVLLAVPQARSDAMDRAWMDDVLRQGLEESPFVEAFYVWSAVSTELPETGCSSTTATASPTSRATSNAGSVTPRASAPCCCRACRQLLEHKRAIVAFPATIGGRRKYVQVQAALPAAPPATACRAWSALVVDAEDIRTKHLPDVMKRRLAAVQHLGGFPQLDLTLRDGKGQVLFSSAPPDADVFVDERSFPLVFFDRELLEYAAPLEVEPETWTLQTGFGGQTIAVIADSSSRPQTGPDGHPGAGHGRRRLLRRRRRGTRGAPGGAEVQLRGLGLARPEDAAGPHPALRRDARARPRAHAGARRRVPTASSTARRRS